jgi:DNA-binding response OmpR family regulator
VGARRYQALVLDLRLPDMTGFDILERLRERGERVPTVIVSVFDDDESRRRAAALGAIGFHQKPFAPEALVSDVRRALTPAERAGRPVNG